MVVVVEVVEVVVEEVVARYSELAAKFAVLVHITCDSTSLVLLAAFLQNGLLLTLDKINKSVSASLSHQYSIIPRIRPYRHVLHSFHRTESSPESDHGNFIPTSESPWPSPRTTRPNSTYLLGRLHSPQARQTKCTTSN